MRIVLIEDEHPARERLRRMVLAFDSGIDIVATPGSVREALAWLGSHATPDLMIVDVQLSDGLSFDIFELHPVSCPLIFATAYDEYMLRALAHNGIDYLLKPIKEEALHRALEKYHVLRRHFTGDLPGLLRELRGEAMAYKERFTVRKGAGFASVRAAGVAFFYTEHKLVFLVERNGEKHVIDRTLAQLEEETDPRLFFRLNRKYLVHIDAVCRFRPHHKGKLWVELSPPVDEDVIISQERAGAFRAWMEG